MYYFLYKNIPISALLFSMSLLLSSQIVTAQNKEEVLIEISKETSSQDKLDYLGAVINKQWYSGSSELSRYVKIYDSIAIINGTDKYLGIASNFNGMSYFVSQEFDTAINYYLAAIRLLEKGEESDALAQAYNNLAGCYKIRDDFDNTEKYFIKALSIYTRLEMTSWIANIHNNLAVLYMESEFYDKADEMFDLAITSYKQSNNTTMIGITYMNQGNSRIFSGDNYDAIEKYLNAMQLIDKNKIPLVHAVSHTGIGIAQTNLKDYSNALLNLKNGLEISEKINHFEQTMESRKALANYYAQTNNFKEAYKLSTLSQQMKDSVLTVKQDKNMAEALIKYEAEKKDKEIALKQLELQKGKSRFRFIIYVNVLFLIIGLGILLFYRQRQKIKDKEIENLKAQKELVKLEALIDGIEKERTRIAQDLHDGINGDLSVIKYKITSIDDNQLKLKEKKEFEKAIEMLDNAIDQVRQISHNLAPPSLQNFSLIEAVQQFCSKVSASSKLPINFQYYGDYLKLDKDIETVIYRMIQELTNNILKHAKATQVLIQINSHNENIHIIVEDNGIGFDISKNHSGLGLKNIESRIAFLNADLIIDTNKNGTTFNIDINLNNLTHD